MFKKVFIPIPPKHRRCFSRRIWCEKLTGLRHTSASIRSVSGIWVDHTRYLTVQKVFGHILPAVVYRVKDVNENGRWLLRALLAALFLSSYAPSAEAHYGHGRSSPTVADQRWHSAAIGAVAFDRSDRYRTSFEKAMDAGKAIPYADVDISAALDPWFDIFVAQTAIGEAKEKESVDRQWDDLFTAIGLAFLLGGAAIWLICWNSVMPPTPRSRV